MAGEPSKPTSLERFVLDFHYLELIKNIFQLNFTEKQDNGAYMWLATRKTRQ